MFWSTASDHITVWVDSNIGFERVPPGWTTTVNDENAFIARMACNLTCFSTPECALGFISANPDSRIFVISSGAFGRTLLPAIAQLPQIQEIYIFCGNISWHTDWADDYVDKISAMFDHQDDLFQRLARDIALYVEGKGDALLQVEDVNRARDYYGCAKSLLMWGQTFSCTGSDRLIDRVSQKLNRL